jgi:hypothetical protein
VVLSSNVPSARTVPVRVKASRKGRDRVWASQGGAGRRDGELRKNPEREFPHTDIAFE